MASGALALQSPPVVTKPDMNGNVSKIEIFRPFGESFEVMKKILFQPFDFRKWLVIGFAAFLVSLSAGLTSSNPLSWSTREDNKAIAESFQDVWSERQIEWWVIALIAVGALIILALVLVLAWVSARGRFIFTDCIVRNRAAIVAPWKEFRAEANSLFIFSVLALLTLIVRYRRNARARASVNLARRWFPAWNRIADRVLRLLICRRLPGFWFCFDFAINGPGHVPPTMSGNGCFRPDGQINRSPSRAGAPLYFVFSRASNRSRSDQLCSNMRDLLHRCDPVRRHSHSFANSSYAWRVFAVVPSAVRSRLRCMGRLYAAGIFACVDATACAFGN